MKKLMFTDYVITSPDTLLIYSCKVFDGYGHLPFWDSSHKHAMPFNTEEEAKKYGMDNIVTPYVVMERTETTDNTYETMANKILDTLSESSISVIRFKTTDELYRIGISKKLYADMFPDRLISFTPWRWNRVIDCIKDILKG